jgi:hypothetical protein
MEMTSNHELFAHFLSDLGVRLISKAKMAQKHDFGIGQGGWKGS